MSNNLIFDFDSLIRENPVHQELERMLSTVHEIKDFVEETYPNKSTEEKDEIGNKLWEEQKKTVLV